MTSGAGPSDDLEQLLDAARRAGKEDRIDYRDAIVEHGARAAQAMREWLHDPELGAFAVRVLEGIAGRAALVLRPEYTSLFSESERQIAASRLAAAGYQPEKTDKS